MAFHVLNTASYPYSYIYSSVQAMSTTIHFIAIGLGNMTIVVTLIAGVCSHRSLMPTSDFGKQVTQPYYRPYIVES